MSGSCVVWMLHPLSAACQDAPSYVRYPEFTRERERERERESVYLCMCVAVCERKPLSGSCVVLNVASTVSSLSRCSVLSQVPGVYERERECVCTYICV